MIRLFISHSSQDVELAELVVRLLTAALALRANEVRCTSVDGYRLPGGAHSDSQIRKEVLAADAFVGILSRSSLGSTYVLFELGARWGAGRHLVPLLGAGVTPRELKGPLYGLNALSCGSQSQLHQLVQELAQVLASAAETPAAYHHHVDAIVQYITVSEALVQAAASKELQRAQDDTSRALTVQASLAREIYGLTVERIASTAVISETGDLITTREVVGVKATAPVRFGLIPVFPKPAGPDSQVAAAPTLQSYNFSRPVTLRLPRESPTNLRGGVEVEGGLGPEDPPLSFTIGMRVQGAFATTRKQAEDAYQGDLFPYERFGDDVFLPVSELVLEVRLPAGMAREVFPVAFFGYSEVQMPSETSRIRPLLVSSGTVHRLVVRSPLYGFRYGICWSLAC